MSDSTSSALDSLPRGYVLLNYTILKVLGRGGFGVTYLAHDNDKNIDVVIKENMPVQCSTRNAATSQVVPLSGRVMEEYFVWALKSFVKEALTLKELEHPYIIRSIELLEGGGTAYYVMHRVDGEDVLRAAQERGGADEDFLRPVTLKLLDALSYLHGKNVLHRDIKPSNILVSKAGDPVLIDFGAAHELMATHTQTIMQSQGYTPIEQLQKKGKTGPWTDIYALGATLYELITGERPPFCTDRLGDESYVPLSGQKELAARYSRSFLSSIDKALALWHQDRWQTAEEWLAALDAGATETAVAPVQNQAKALSVQKSEQDPKTAALQELRKRGITDINSLDDNEYTPLHRACEEGDAETASLLITAGAEIDVRGHLDWTPLHVACHNSAAEMVRLLVNAGADVQAKDITGWTPLVFADTAEIAQILVGAGADIQAKDDNGWTPLLWACCGGTAEMVQWLVNAGADLKVKADDGSTVLHTAVENDYNPISLLEMLLSAGVDLHAKDNDGDTALHQACKIGKIACVQCLISAGADVLARNNRGETPIDVARSEEEEEIEALLLGTPAGALLQKLQKRGITDVNSRDDAGNTPLHRACVEGDAETAALLIAAGSDVHAKEHDGWAPLHLACRSGIEKMVQLLVEGGADVQAGCNGGWTPSHIACLCSTAEIVQLLVNAGADLKVKADDGSTLLHAAAHNTENDSSSIMEMLLSAGVDINAKDTAGDTALHAVLRESNRQCVQLLLSAGADLRAKNNKGETPIDVARKTSSADIDEMLQNVKNVFSRITKSIFS